METNGPLKACLLIVTSQPVKLNKAATSLSLRMPGIQSSNRRRRFWGGRRRCGTGLLGSLGRRRLGGRRRGLCVMLVRRIRRKCGTLAGLVLVARLSFAAGLFTAADCGKTRSLF